jgi:hypothetical protein
MSKGGKNTKQTKQPKRNGGAAFMAEVNIIELIEIFFF